MLAVVGLSASAAEVTDVLSVTSLSTDPNYSASSTSYATYTVTGESGAEYSLQCAHNKGTCIQLRSTNSNSGIVATKSPGKVVKVTVEWAENTANNRTLNIYGGASAFAITGLYGNSAPSVAGTIVKGTSTSFDFTDYPEYIGMRSSSGAMYLTKISITWDIADSSKQPAGLKYETTNYTVELGDAFTAPELTNPNGLAVTYTSSDENVATVASDGKVTLVGVGTTKITATSAETAEFNAGSAFYNLTVVKSYSTVAEFYTVGANNKGLIGFDLIVTYVNGANCYAQTEDGEATLIYGSTSYEVGDIIPAGWEGQYAPFNGLDEIKPVGTMPAASGTTTFVPAEVTSVSKADMNRVVVLKNVKFDAATVTGSTKKNFDGTVDDVTYTFRNNFADVPSVEAGLYNVKLAVSYYVDKNNNETLQLYPIAYTAITETGIDDVVVDENAPVEYYNLQGVRVANPENGLYIRRQGNKATKVLVK